MMTPDRYRAARTEAIREIEDLAQGAPAERVYDAIERAVFALVVLACEEDDLDTLADHPAVAYLTLSESEKEEIDKP